MHTINNLASTAVLSMIFLTSYKFLPRRKIRWQSALVGTAVGIVLFEIGKYILALALSFSMIIDFYGSMGSLVMLMFWVYYTVQILLIGAECAIEFETTLSSKIDA
jgi:membrane protein